MPDPRGSGVASVWGSQGLWNGGRGRESQSWGGGHEVGVGVASNGVVSRAGVARVGARNVGRTLRGQSRS